MKKILALTLIFVLGLTMAACGAPASSATPAAGDTMSLTDMMANILTIEAEIPKVSDIPLTDDLFKNFAFIDPIEGAEALASEAMVNAAAHSVVLIRVPEGTDVATVAKEIETNMDPRKWVCVEAEKSIVATHGSTILLVMSSEDAATQIAANFDKLWA